MKIIQILQARLEGDGKDAAVAVVDAHGELMAFLRTDGCLLAPIQIAINKAFSAAREQRESSVIGDAAREMGFPITNYGDLRYTGWGGGVPIIHEGEVVGAVGISGLVGASEADWAREAIAAL